MVGHLKVRSQFDFQVKQENLDTPAPWLVCFFSLGKFRIIQIGINKVINDQNILENA